MGCRSALHGEEGPLHWLVHQVLRAGQRSPRLLALAALHLAPLFLACPSVALYYQEHIKQLLLCNVDHASSQVCHLSAPCLAVPTADCISIPC